MKDEEALAVALVVYLACKHPHFAAGLAMGMFRLLRDPPPAKKEASR